MKRLFRKIFCSLVLFILVASETVEQFRVAGECNTLNCRRERTLKAKSKGWLMADWPVKEGRRPNGLLEQAHDLNESYRKMQRVSKIFQQVLSCMRDNLKATTLVVFGSSEEISFRDIAAESHVPLLIVNNKLDWHIAGQFRKNILSMILLPSDHTLPLEIFAALEEALKGLRLKKILIICESLLGEQDKLTRLIDWFYSKDFWQILLMDYAENTLTLEPLTGHLLKNRTLKEFMVADVNWRNLHDITINCFIALNPPRVFVQDDAHNNTILKGFFGSVVTLFSQHYKASLQEFIFDNYTEMECVEYISKGQYDICSDGLPYDSERYSVTYPEELVQSFVIVRNDEPLARFYYFLKPFQQNVWLVVTASFFYKILTLSLIHRLQQGSWNSSLQILYAIVSVLYLPFQLTHIKPPYRGFLEIIMICVGFVVANWYLSVLSSLLFTRLYSHDINSFQDLWNHNISIMVDEFEFFLLNSSQIDPIIRQQLLLVPKDSLLTHRRNLDTSYAYYSQYDKIDYYLYQQRFLQRPRMKILKPAVNIIVGGVAMRPNWPFQRLLNDFYWMLFESGVYMRLYTDALEEGIHSGHLQYFTNKHHYVEALTMEYFQMPAILLACGFLLAMSAFLLELFVFKTCCRQRV